MPSVVEASSPPECQETTAACETPAHSSRLQRVFPLLNKPAGSQVKHQAAIHLGIEGKVRVVGRALSIGEAGFLSPTFQQPIGAPVSVHPIPGTAADRWAPSVWPVLGVFVFPALRPCLSAATAVMLVPV